MQNLVQAPRYFVLNLFFITYMEFFQSNKPLFCKICYKQSSEGFQLNAFTLDYC